MVELLLAGDLVAVEEDLAALHRLQGHLRVLAVVDDGVLLRYPDQQTHVQTTKQHKLQNSYYSLPTKAREELL